jgi:hypothetical protein
MYRKNSKVGFRTIYNFTSLGVLGDISPDKGGLLYFQITDLVKPLHFINEEQRPREVQAEPRFELVQCSFSYSPPNHPGQIFSSIFDNPKEVVIFPRTSDPNQSEVLALSLLMNRKAL